MILFNCYYKSQQNRLAETIFIEENVKEKRLMAEEIHKRKQEWYF